MDLVLSITSFHKFTPELKSVYTLSSEDEHGSIKFGRADTCDWILPDPERIISGVHGEISKSGSSYLLRDLSTNGIFINKSVSPIGIGVEITLSHRDTISFGDYEIEVSLIKNQLELSLDKNSISSSSHTLSPRDCLKNSVEIRPMDNMDFGFDANLFLSQEEATSLLHEPEIGGIEDFFDTKSVSNNIEICSVNSVNEEEQLPLFRKVEKQSDLKLDSLLNAFLSGAGINKNLIPDIDKEAWFKELGRSYALMLDGLMKTLHNRAKFKQKNRLNHTAFQHSENNPLKFSANIDDAIHNLYNRKSASFLAPEVAIKSAFQDIEYHEKAMINGVHGAVSGVMKLLDPQNISEQAIQKENLLFNIRLPNNKNNWKKYENIYEKLNNDLDIEGQERFYLEDFSKAYEMAIKNIEG